jgi:phosphate acetyltransferase
MNFTEVLRDKAKGSQSKIVLARSSDPRVQQAANLLVELNIGKVYMVRNHSKGGLNSSDRTEVGSDRKALASTLENEKSIELNSKIHWIDPREDSRREEFADFLYEKRKNKGWSRERCEKIILDPLYFTGCLLAKEYMDVGVAGSVSTTGEVLRAAIHTIGLRSGSTTISSSFIMELSTGEVVSFGDCAVIPMPNAEQLATIAHDSAMVYHSLTGVEPKIALLSFSTNGSAEHERVQVPRDALKLYKELGGGFDIDGELQFDAAWDATVARRKAPDSLVAGQANVFVFPSLEAGNIGYKMVERLAGARATGPIIQGLNKPMLDLSRGCDANDIVNTACVGVLMTKY